MKYIFSIIVFLHGAIHLLGFVKGFGISRMESLAAEISKPAAIFWLAAFLLFTLSAGLYLAQKQLWAVFVAAAFIVSVVLIAGNWSDAKFGLIPNAIILIALVITFSGCAFNKKIAAETDAILETVGETDETYIEDDDLLDLPEPVKKWLRASGTVNTPKVKSVYLQQKFQMKLKPEQENWYLADAEQYFTTENPAFIWTVKLNMSPFVSVRGRDKFTDGKGEMQMKLYALLNLGKETGEKMDEGTLQRYLGEIVWFPSAALSPYIKWEAVDSLTAKATMNYKGTTGSGIFYFNAEGDFIKYSAMRYMGNEPDAERREWIIEADNHAVFNGIKVPSEVHATWRLDEGDWTWCRIRLSNLVYNASDS
jgi:hypothetical protein